MIKQKFAGWSWSAMVAEVNTPAASRVKLHTVQLLTFYKILVSIDFTYRFLIIQCLPLYLATFKRAGNMHGIVFGFLIHLYKIYVIAYNEIITVHV